MYSYRLLTPDMNDYISIQILFNSISAMVHEWRRLERSKAAQLQSVGSGPLESEGSGRGGYPWRPLSLQLLFVFCRFAGFWCSVQAFGIQSPASFTWLAAFGLAYAVGLVVPGAPGGLGVFEATLLLRLGAAVPEAQLLAVVLSYPRSWNRPPGV